MSFALRPLVPSDAAWLTAFMHTHWGDDNVVAHGVVYYPAHLPGWVALEAEMPVGVVTYHIADAACEVVTLDSVRENLGVGTALIDATRQSARAAGCHRLWLITTNDNLRALRFYQKRGFELVAVHRRAVEQARTLKPTIPLLGYDAIPIRDEIELEMQVA